MSNLPVIVVGAGGHGRVVADALRAGSVAVLGFVDTAAAGLDPRLVGDLLLGDDTALDAYDPANVMLANGIGGLGDASAASRRRQVQVALQARGWHFVTVRHPSAIVSPTASIGAGAQLLAACVVQPGAVVGDGAIVNTRAVVEHDTRVGAWSHVAPGAVLCGNVVLGENCHVGAGAVVRQGIELGDCVVVGVGAAVVAAVTSGVVAGVPARPLRVRS
jgi:UDP-perosamine 4-acetyltransferase